MKKILILLLSIVSFGASAQPYSYGGHGDVNTVIVENGPIDFKQPISVPTLDSLTKKMRDSLSNATHPNIFPSIWRLKADSSLRVYDAKTKISTRLIDSVILMSNFIGYVTPQMFGAKADDVTNDGSAINAAIATGKMIYMGDSTKRYFTTVGFTLKRNQVMRGDHARIRSASAINIITLSTLSEVSGIDFFGAGMSSGVNQTGVFLDGGVAYNSATRGKIVDCGFYDMGANGIRITRSVDLHAGTIISRCRAERCAIGINLDERGEYNSVDNCILSACNTNIRISGGNNTVSASEFNDAVSYNALIQVGQNDAHGQFNGCTFNHGGLFAVKIEATNTPEFSFNNCYFYYGIVYLYQCNGVVFNNGVITGGSIYEEGAIDCYFNGVKFGDAVPITNNRNGLLSKVIYNECTWPAATVPYNNIRRLGGSLLSMTRVGTQVVPFDATDSLYTDTLNFNTTIQNSITCNTTYLVDTFYNATQKFIDFTKIVSQTTKRVQSTLKMTVTVGASSGAFDDSKVHVYLYDLVTNKVIGVFAKGVELGTTLKYRTYTYSGVVPTTKVQLRVDNRTLGNLNFYGETATTLGNFQAMGF